MTNVQHEDVVRELEEKLKTLPLSVQNAVTSVNPKNKLQNLSQKHRLHLDQWQLLEEEVMFAILGIEPAAKLNANLKRELGISDDIANSLAKDVSDLIFVPIRQELERQLEHPEAQEKQLSGVEAAREQALGEEKADEASTPTMPAPTPPAPKAEASVARAPASGAYKPGEASTARKSIADDPYRELPQ